MGSWLLTLFSTEGFVPRKECGSWTTTLMWLHAGSEVLIWLAYTAIPVTLVFLARGRRVPFKGLFALFAAFILACGTTHLIEAFLFEYPVYRLSGVAKALTAVISWVTVIALVPLLPRALRAAEALGEATAALPALPAGESAKERQRQYVAAVLFAVCAVLARAVLDPVMKSDHAFVLPLLAVVGAAWYGGFWPGLAALFISMVGVTYFFVAPRQSLAVSAVSDQFAVGLFLFAGFGCSLLGESQRQNRLRAQRTVAELNDANTALASSRSEMADAVAQLEAVLANVSVGVALFDRHLAPLRMNERFAPLRRPIPTTNGTGEFAVGREAELTMALAEVVRDAKPMPRRQFPLDDRLWDVRAHPVFGKSGSCDGVVVTAQDVTERERWVGELQASEARFRELAEAMPQIVWVTRPDGYHEYYNARWYEFTGLTPEESIGHQWNSPLHPDDRERAKLAWAHSLATGDRYEIEYRFRGHDGRYRWFLGIALPVRDAAGAIQKWVGTCTDIDDRRAAEERYRSLVDSIPQLAWVAEGNGDIFTYNRRWYDYTGTTKDEMFDESGWGWKKVHHPEHIDRVVRRWKEHVAAGKEFEELFPIRRHDGVYRWHLTRAVPQRDAAGNVLRWFGSNTDVTEQKEAEQRLRESEAKFRSLAESLPVAVWTTRPDGANDFLSQHWLDYTGRPFAEQEGFGWLDVVHPDDRGPAGDAWTAANAGRKPYLFSYRVRRADGAYRWFDVRGVPQLDDEGKLIRYVGSAADVHDQREAAARLEELVRQRTAEIEEQQNFLDAILANVADGIVACDGDGKLRLFNDSAKEFHGLPADQLPPEQWTASYDLYEADGVTPMPTDRVPLMRALSGERVRDAEMVIRPKNLPERYLLASGQPLTDRRGRNLGAVVSMRDQTERRAALQQLERFATELQRSNAELEKFAYVASHDLQEPLRKIQAFGDRLGKKYRDTLGEQGKDYVDRMLASAGRMRTLIDDLLAFSRVATKGQPFAPVDLAATARDVLSDLEVRVAQTGAEVRVGPLPTILADRVQMRQFFQNLIGNALKFHAPDRAPLIEVAAVPLEELPEGCAPPPAAERGWRISVRDNGIGFDQQYTDRIFEVFQRLHGREQYEGTGIGLAIVRKIAERHGGRITARSRAGEGALFVADFPALPDVPAGAGGVA